LVHAGIDGTRPFLAPPARLAGVDRCFAPGSRNTIATKANADEAPKLTV